MKFVSSLKLFEETKTKDSLNLNFFQEMKTHGLYIQRISIKQKLEILRFSKILKKKTKDC
jgi:hypothetical protein